MIHCGVERSHIEAKAERLRTGTTQLLPILDIKWVKIAYI